MQWQLNSSEIRTLDQFQLIFEIFFIKLRIYMLRPFSVNKFLFIRSD